LVESDHENAPFAEFYGGVVMGIDTLSIEHTDPICNGPLDLTPTSPLYLPKPRLMRMPLMSPSVNLEVIIPPLIPIAHT